MSKYGIEKQVNGFIDVDSESTKEKEKTVILGRFVENEIIEFNEELNKNNKNSKLIFIDEEGKKHIIY